MEEKKVLRNNILIIEDEHDICEVYSEVLSMAGYKVQEAADGETGMQKIRDENWDEYRCSCVTSCAGVL